MWNIYITRKIPQVGIDLLKRECKIVEINQEDRNLTLDELKEKVKGRDAILCTLADPINKEVIDIASPTVKIFANYAVGYDNIDVEYAKQKGIAVTNTPGVLTDATAELAWALLFAVARRVVESDKYLREGKFKGWSPMLLLGTEITGKTLGIIGAGRIGTAFALKSKGFQMQILYYDEIVNHLLEKELNAKKVELKEILQKSDFISLHTPLTPQTKHLIGEKEFAQMKRTAFLINTSRGAVIDEKALLKALKEKTIAGAGLDVYEFEPKITEGLTDLDNVVLLPHLGSATTEAREKMAIMSAENIITLMKGKTPPNLVL